MMKRAFILLVCVLTGMQLNLCFPQAYAYADNTAEKDYTLMVYIVGSDLEENYGMASNTVSQMMNSDADMEKANILCMTGGAARWTAGIQDPEKTLISRIGTALRRSRVTLWEGPSMNMGEPETLQFFLNYCVENFPAKNYMLILWGHGGGPANGFGFDFLYERDALTLPEMEQAFRGSPFAGSDKLSWIIFDSSLMGNLEVAQMLSPYAGFMIADELDGTGFDYGFLNVLDAQKPAEEVSKAIIEDYMKAADGLSVNIAVSCVDLNALNPVLEARDSLISALKEHTDETDLKAILEKAGLADASGFTGLSSYNLYDLGLLAVHSKDCAPQEADSLLQALETAVVYRQGNVEDAAGLSTRVESFE